MSRLRRISGIAKRPFSVVAAVVVGVATVGLAPTAALAAPVTSLTAGLVYDNIPNPQPGNVSSEAFEAQSASEFGGVVKLSVSSVTDPVVTVLMSSWGCQSGHWFSGDCATTPGATFSEPITLNVYAAGPAVEGASPGSLLLTSTTTFAIPYRPSSDPTHCTGANAGKWYFAATATCFNGFATPITFHVSGHLATNTVVVSLAYNTTHYGYHPYGEGTACFTSPGSCGYDSLNVGLSSPPSVGTLPHPNDAYVNSTWSGAYCGSANPSTGSFAYDAGCWTGFQPAVAIQQGSVATVLHAQPSIAQVLPGLVITLKLSARLTTVGGVPILGEPVNFFAATGFVCSGITNANGVASCGSLLHGVTASIISLGYAAEFAGDGVLLPSATHGPLIRIG